MSPETGVVTPPYTLARGDGAVPPDGILSRTLVRDRGVSATLFGFAPGEELTDHASARPAIVQIVSGEADVTVAGEALRLGTGDLLHMGAGVVHSVRAPGPLSFLLVLLPATDA